MDILKGSERVVVSIQVWGSVGQVRWKREDHYSYCAFFNVGFNKALIVVTIAYLYEYTKNHCIGYFKWVNCMYLNYISIKLLYMFKKN